jgi:hypothetical protein
LAKAVAYGSYEGGLRELIHLLKSGGIQRAWSVLGRMLADAIEDLEIDFPRARVAVVSVPRDRAKRDQRGRRLLEGVLESKRDTCPQTGLTSHQRRKNMRAAFTLARPEEVKGRPLLGVDDLYVPEFCTAPEHLKYGSPQWRARSRYRRAKGKSCDLRKAMKRLCRWRKRPAAEQRSVDIRLAECCQPAVIEYRRCSARAAV